jgi:hypothetical protein
MPKMTSTDDRQTDASDHAASIARWDDEGGAPKSLPGKTSDKSSGTSASWFVPPIVVPAFFAALIIVSSNCKSEAYVDLLPAQAPCWRARLYND